MKTVLLAGLAVLALILGFVSAELLREAAPARAQPAPDFVLNDLNGTGHRKADYAGRVLMVNFWASWCAPCLKEMPRLNAAYAARRDQGLAILGPAIDDSADAAATAARLKVSYPVAPGGAELFELMDAMGDTLGALPFTVLIDRDGQIVERHWGELDQATLDHWLQRHL